MIFLKRSEPLYHGLNRIVVGSGTEIIDFVKDPFSGVPTVMLKQDALLHDINTTKWIYLIKAYEVSSYLFGLKTKYIGSLDATYAFEVINEADDSKIHSKLGNLLREHEANRLRSVFSPACADQTSNHPDCGRGYCH